MATPREVFTSLSTRFRFDAKIVEKILEAGINTLSDFRYFCSTEAEVVQTFVTPVEKDLANPRLEAARLKHAWAAMVAQEAASSTLSMDPVDEDELLPAVQLADMKAAFLKRYKVSFVPQQPSERLLSKLRRALARRSLVRSMFNQRMAVAKKRKITSNLWVQEGPDEDQSGSDVIDKTCQAWLDMLWMSVREHGRHYADRAVKRGSDPALYVQVPWDVVLKYHWRARSLALKLGDHAALPRLIELDQQERAEWASRFFFGGSTPLGAVIQAVYKERDVHWQVQFAVPTMAPASPKAPAATPKGRAPAPPASARTSPTLRDGAPLCAAWQQGRCQQQRDNRCAEGQRRCNRLLQSGRVCGSTKHGSGRCDAKGRV